MFFKPETKPARRTEIAILAVLATANLSAAPVVTATRAAGEPSFTVESVGAYAAGSDQVFHESTSTGILTFPATRRDWVRKTFTNAVPVDIFVNLDGTWTSTRAQAARVAELEARVAELEARIAELETGAARPKFTKITLPGPKLTLEVVPSAGSTLTILGSTSPSGPWEPANQSHRFFKTVQKTE